MNDIQLILTQTKKTKRENKAFLYPVLLLVAELEKADSGHTPNIRYPE